MHCIYVQHSIQWLAYNTCRTGSSLIIRFFSRGFRGNEESGEETRKEKCKMSFSCNDLCDDEMILLRVYNALRVYETLSKRKSEKTRAVAKQLLTKLEE